MIENIKQKSVERINFIRLTQNDADSLEDATSLTVASAYLG